MVEGESGLPRGLYLALYSRKSSSFPHPYLFSSAHSIDFLFSLLPLALFAGAAVPVGGYLRRPVLVLLALRAESGAQGILHRVLLLPRRQLLHAHPRSVV